MNTIKIYNINTDELVYVYDTDLEPEIIDCGHYFIIYYDGEDEDGNKCVCQCDYESNKYYYIKEINTMAKKDERLKENEYIDYFNENAPEDQEDIMTICKSASNIISDILNELNIDFNKILACIEPINIQHCTDCPNFRIIEDKRKLCTYAKCMKTSYKGKTMDWKMTHCYTPTSTGLVEDEPAEDYLRKRAGRLKIPKWCPDNLG